MKYLKIICLILWGLICINGIYEYHDSFQPIEWVIMISMLVIPLVIAYFSYRRKRAKENIDTYYIQSLLYDANKCASIVNTTCDASVFFKKIDQIYDLLRKLKKYEKYKVFTNSCPSKDYHKLKRNMYKTELNFINRARTTPNFFTDIEPYIPRLSLIAKLKLKWLLFKDSEINNMSAEPLYNPPENILDKKNISLGSTPTNIEIVDAAIFIIESQKTSIGSLQKEFKISFNKAITIMQRLVELGVLSQKGELAYHILSDMDDLIYICQKNNMPTESLPIITTHYLPQPTQSFDFDNMEGHQFEYFCADLLRKNGFINVEVTQGSGDYGIDVLAEKDEIKYAIQCKCYSKNISNTAVQEAHSGKDIYNCDVGVVMTNRYFTKSAIETAKKHKIKLWNRDKLLKFIENTSQNSTTI